jgi:hypothetical protein
LKYGHATRGNAGVPYSFQNFLGARHHFAVGEVRLYAVRSQKDETSMVNPSGPSQIIEQCVIS